MRKTQGFPQLLFVELPHRGVEVRVMLFERLHVPGPIYIGEGDFSLSVDPTKAFGPGGGLEVAGAMKIIDPTLQTLEYFDKRRRILIKDVHPWGHINYASSYLGREPEWLTLREVMDGKVRLAPHALFTIEDLIEYILLAPEHRIRLWPDHAKFDTDEIELLPGLKETDFGFTFYKGMLAKCDSHSGIRDALRRPTGLTPLLKTGRARRVFSKCLAADFCVGYNAEDAAIDGFESYIVIDACAAVDIPASGDYPGSIAVMEKRLEAVGAKVITSDQLRAA